MSFDNHSAKLLISLIHNSFAKVDQPKAHELVDFDGLDEENVIQNFSNKTTKDVLAEIFEGDCSAEDLRYMSQKAFLYYIPAYLEYLLHNENRNDFESIIGVIEVMVPSFVDNETTVNYPNFSMSQLNIIVQWLEFLKDKNSGQS